MRGPIQLRSLRAADRPAIERILRATGVFTGEEVDVALELVDLGLRPEQREYSFVVVETVAEAVAGYACFGPTPLTEGVWDLYWIAVDPAIQSRGLGRQILAAVEAAVRAGGGRMVLVETASKPSYKPTRALYRRTNYVEVARIPDFYRVGDDKVIFVKTLS